MAFLANALRIVIASPGEAAEERDIVTGEIYRWNETNAVSRKLILLPMKWENRATEQNDTPSQDAINPQTPEEPDILIGIFGERIGKLQEEQISATVEEIKRHVGAGRAATVYFSDAAYPPTAIVTARSRALKTFKDECGEGGLSATYSDLDTFKSSFRQQLALELNKPRYRWLPESAQGAELPLSADARRVLSAAARAEGHISTMPAVGGDVIYVGRERMSDGTARTIALLKEVFQDLRTRGLIEPTGSKTGNYHLTAPGFRAADKAIEEEEEKKKQLDSDGNIAATPAAPTLRVASKQSTRH